VVARKFLPACAVGVTLMYVSSRLQMCHLMYLREFPKIRAKKAVRNQIREYRLIQHSPFAQNVLVLKRDAVSHVAAIAVVILLAAAGGVVYFLNLAPSSISTTALNSTSQSTSSESTAASTPSSASTGVRSSTTSTPRPSSSSSSQTTTSLASTQTLTATCSQTTTGISALSTVLALIPQLEAYPSMTLSFDGKTTTMSASLDFNLSYAVVVSAPTSLKVDVNYSLGARTLSFTAWLLKNGTTLALNFGQGNITGTQASNDVVTYFGGFATVQGFVQQQSVYSNLFRSNGTSTTTIGTNTFTVTNYIAYQLPENIQVCGGGTTTLTAYNLSEGTPTGSSYELPTYVNIAGYTTINGTTTPFFFTIQITAFTVA